MKKLLLPIVFFATAFSFAQNILELNPSNFPVANPCGFMDFNNKLFYVGTNPTYSRELFATDGTLAGNQLVKDIGNQYFSQTTAFLINSAQQSDGKFAKFNGKLYFEANNQYSLNNFKLWSTDGTESGTQMIAPSNVYGPIKHFKEFNGRLYFTALGLTTGCEIWSTDGTTSGTDLLKDINPNSSESSIDSYNTAFNPCFTVFNNKLYFVANDGVHGLEIWSTDGTTAGTSMLKDINVGGSIFIQNYANDKVQPFVVYNDRMYFKAYSFIDNLGVSFENLWSTDGTEAGTVMFEVPLGTNYSGQWTTNYLIKIQGLTVANNKLYIFGKSLRDGINGYFDRGLWQTDGTSINSIPLQGFENMFGINGYLDDAISGSMREYNGEYYFLADAIGSNLSELWKINPITNNFTKIVANPTAFASCFESNKLLVSQVFDGKLYFVQNNVNPGIYSTNGTVSGTTISAKNSINGVTITNKSHSTQAMTTYPDQLKVFGNSLYFNAGFNSADSSLWRITNPALSNDTFLGNDLKLNLFPNPVSNQMNISFKIALNDAYLKITSLTGQTILEQKNINGTEFNIDVSNLNSGLYLIQISDSQNSFSSKFIKQ